MLDALVDLELGMGLEIFPDGCLGVVARPPGAVGEHVGGHVFDNSVKNDAVTALAGEWSISL